MKFKSINDMLRQLQEADWTAHLGHPIDGSSARVVNSWDDVMQVLEDEEMIDFLSEQSNLISDDVSKDMPAYRKWNEFVENLRPEIEEIVWERIRDDACERSSREKICMFLTGDTIGAAIEIYYRSLTRRDFHQSFVIWLLKGHIPIGWELGHYPKGRAIVY